MAKVLVAEDDVGIRTLVGSVLRRAGHSIEFAADGNETIDRLCSSDYDAVLLDLMMPTASGFEVLAWMHREKRGAAKRIVIVMTAMAERDLSNLTEQRVFAVMRKPFDIDELVAKLDLCLAMSPTAPLDGQSPVAGEPPLEKRGDGDHRD
jgi:two-component system alkaline phosphatase synthesis response regulator PhoP